VLPAVQARRLTERFAVHIFESVGHMLPTKFPTKSPHWSWRPPPSRP
jgi:hypothetical protein